MRCSVVGEVDDRGNHTREKEMGKGMGCSENEGKKDEKLKRLWNVRQRITVRSFES